MKKQYIKPATDTYAFDTKEMVLTTGTKEGLGTDNNPKNNISGDAREGDMIVTIRSIWDDEEE